MMVLLLELALLTGVIDFLKVVKSVNFMNW